MKTLKKIVLVLAILALGFGAVCFEAWLGMLLFNWVAGLFCYAFALTFWQAFGACILLNFVSSFFRKSKNS